MPPDDPLLAGGYALLDREFQTIWLNRERPIATQHVDAAHEYGHFYLHGQPREDSEEVFLSLEGYSKNQRDEVDAHRFADEFLLPFDIARALFLEGFSSSKIARRIEAPTSLVIKQLVIAFADPKALEASGMFLPSLDSWQLEAVRCEQPVFVIGGPGSGKTISLVARCHYLVGQMGVTPSKILVVADSRKSTNELRWLLDNAGEDSARIPVTTVHQLAYDILIRFPKSAGLDERWEENRDENRRRLLDNFGWLLQMVSEAVKQSPEIIDVLQRRYVHLMVDNFDELSLGAQQFLQKIFDKSRGGFWATLRRKQSNPRGYRELDLPYHYRFASIPHRFYSKCNPSNEKRSILRRSETIRCGVGSVTIALSNTTEQEAAGIAQFIMQKEMEGYQASEVSVYYRSGSTNGAVLDAKIAEKLGQLKHAEGTDKFTAQLLGFLQLMSGDWNRSSILRAGQIRRYEIPLPELITSLRTWRPGAPFALPQFPGWAKLISDLDQCRRAHSRRDALELYVFQLTDYLRHDPSAGRPIQSLLHALRSENLPGRPIGRSFLTRRSEARTVPIVVVADTEINNILKWATSRRSFATVPLEIEAVSNVEDHLLLSVQHAESGEVLRKVRRLNELFPEATLLKWSDGPKATRRAFRASGGSYDQLCDSERAVFAQCPRRVYYDRQLFGDSDSHLSSVNFPAAPADQALCLSCSFVDICPTELT
jgi:hypothetical protein